MKKLSIGLACLSFVACGTQLPEESLSKVQSVASWEDCIPLNYTNLTVVASGGGFTIRDGNQAAFHFPTFADAQRGRQVLQTYRVTQTCFVGRPGPSMKYLLSGPSAVAPSGQLLSGEDCIGFDRSNLQIRFINGSYKIVDGNHWLLDFGSSLSEAQTSLNVINRHKFDEQCFVRRPNAPLIYWKKNPVIQLPVAVTKSNCSSHVANAGSSFQCPAGRVVSGISDNMDVFGAFETVSCCSLSAGAAAVTYSGAPQTFGFSLGATATCPANKYLTGIGFNPQGTVSSVTCRGLASAGKTVQDTGGISETLLYAHGSATCAGSSLGKALGDTSSPDGHVDTLRCRAAVRAP